MTDFNFTPTERPKLEHAGVKIPYFENARADFAPYYDVRDRTIEQAKSAVTAEVGKLGGAVIAFHEGYFGTGSEKRYGYIVDFQYGGAKGQFKAAGLPFKSGETENKIVKVRLQALLNIRDWLKSAVTAQVFSPGSDILIQYLLVDGKRTLVEVMKETGKLPALSSIVGDIVDGEVVE